MPMSIRDSISSAFDAAEEVAEVAPVEAVAPVEPAEVAPVEPVETEAGPEEIKPVESRAAKADRLRDEAGKFAKKEAAAKVEGEKAPLVPKVVKTAAVAPAVAGETPVVTPTAPVFKAPQSWKPAAREQWAKLPSDVQGEVTRREKEASAALNETAGARQFVGDFGKTISPYLPMIQGDGSNPLKFVGDLLQTAAVLRTGDPTQRAQAAAQIVKRFGVDIAALDAALAGQAPAAGQQQRPSEYKDPRVDQLFSTLAQQRQAQQQQAAAEGQRDVDTFKAGAEFFEDVREHMAMLMSDATARRQPMTLQQAYDKACRLDDSISGILSQRKAAETAKKNQVATQQKRAAGSSVKSSPSGGVGSTPKQPSMRDTIVAAFGDGR